jgi:hypothetical protein
MRTTLWLGVLLSSSALVACGGGDSDPDAPPTVDSPPGAPDARVDADPNAPDASPEFACNGVPIPTTGAATLTITGDMAALSASGSTPVEGADIEGYINGNNTPVATTTSMTAGAYTITINNPGTAPVDGYLKAASAGNLTVFLHPPTPIYTDIPMAPLRTLPTSLVDVFYALAQVTPMAGRGVIAVVVTDCLGNPLTGATVTSDPAGDVRYNGANGLPTGPGGASSTAADGVAFIANLPVGTVSVDADYNGVDMRAHSFLIRAIDGADDAINTTTIIP